jgi:phosphohistidine phosphatase SixA
MNSADLPATTQASNTPEAHMRTLHRLLPPLLLFCLGLAAGTAAAQPEPDPANDERLWTLLGNGEAAALMRHALAPGTGDPADFAIDDCATQRNLSDTGREQARAIGERFRAKGIDTARVHSSRWCRCLETARLLDLGEVRPFDGLNSFFRNRAAEPERTAATLALIRAQTRAGAPPLVLVTHQVNITALTGVFPDSGEIVVVRPGSDGLTILGRIATR